MQKKLEVKDLVISFRTQGGKVQAVRKVSFDLFKGETLAIVGESGSGKSVTNRAIMGILANNALVEGGEIIYDGQDLLQISEDDFHKIRGDKIAMIFQDPMSSLNPIMRVGNQLTEAMLLKSKASQKNAKKEFNDKLALLNAFMDKTVNTAEERAKNKQMCDTFNAFCISGINIEEKYNVSSGAVIEVKTAAEDLLFLVEKNQKIDVKAKLKEIYKIFVKTLHPYVIVANDENKALLDSLKLDCSKEKGKTLSEDCVAHLNKVIELCNEAESKIKPNFFTIGFYAMKNPNEDVERMPIEQLNKMTREYLDKEFMNEFIALASGGVKFAHEQAISLKKAAIPHIDTAIEYFSGESLDKATSYKTSEEVVKLVEESINRLNVVKNSTEYIFHTTVKSALDKYFKGVENNPKEQARFEKQSAKREKLVAKGKNPDWKVVPAVLVDIEAARGVIIRVFEKLKNNLLKQIDNAEAYDVNANVMTLIDFFKEKASAVVYHVTPRMARAKALKLLEEVGIPEPAIRYNQYPFEFSGGMRQRIVIAIALAANPDILICDEPTTALDVTIQSQILELINRLKTERNLSVIFITHDLGVVANMADRIAVMYAGKIVEYGTADDVFYAPAHPYTWALLSSMPDLDTKEKLEAIPGTPPNMIFPPKGDAFAARNKYALEIDYEMQPPMFKVSDTHYAATWLLHPDAPKVAPPKIVTDRIERMTKKEASLNE